MPILPQLAAAFHRELLDASPFCRALGLASVDAPLGRLKIAMPAAPFLGDSKGGTLHPGALGGLVDTALSISAYQDLPAKGRAATIDLRIDLFRPAANAGVVAVGRLRHMDERRVMTEGDLIEAGAATPFGRMIATLSRARPGPTDFASRSVFEPPCARGAVGFMDWLGVRRESPSRHVADYQPAFAATDAMPRHHGGAVAAILTTAAVDAAAEADPTAMLTSVTCSFLVFAEPASIVCDTRILRVSRSMATLDVTAVQDGGRTIAHAIAQFQIGRA